MVDLVDRLAIWRSPRELVDILVLKQSAAHHQLMLKAKRGQPLAILVHVATPMSPHRLLQPSVFITNLRVQVAHNEEHIVDWDPRHSSFQTAVE